MTVTAQKTVADKPLDALSAREAISKIGTGSEVTVKRKDGQGFYGSIEKIGPDAVTIADVAMKASIQVPFNEIQEIAIGRGDARPWNGKAHVSHTRRNVAIALLAIGIIIPIIISASRRPSDPTFTR